MVTILADFVDASFIWESAVPSDSVRPMPAAGKTLEREAASTCIPILDAATTAATP